MHADIQSRSSLQTSSQQISTPTTVTTAKVNRQIDLPTPSYPAPVALLMILTERGPNTKNVTPRFAIRRVKLVFTVTPSPADAVTGGRRMQDNALATPQSTDKICRMKAACLSCFRCHPTQRNAVSAHQVPRCMIAAAPATHRTSDQTTRRWRQTPDTPPELSRAQASSNATTGTSRHSRF